MVYLIGAVIVFLLSIPSRTSLQAFSEGMHYTVTSIWAQIIGVLSKPPPRLLAVYCAQITSQSVGAEAKESPWTSAPARNDALVHPQHICQVEIVGRLRYYFALFAVLAIPEALDRAPKAERGIVKTVVCAAFLTYFIVICIARPEWYGTIPYSADLERLFALP